MKSKALMDFEQIENEFFDITGDIAIVRLHFENPDVSSADQYRKCTLQRNSELTNETTLPNETRE